MRQQEPLNSKLLCVCTHCVYIYILVGSWILTSHQPLGVTKLHLVVPASEQSPSENTADDSNG